jgi:hypothetical protein
VAIQKLHGELRSRDICKGNVKRGGARTKSGNGVLKNFNRATLPALCLLPFFLYPPALFSFRSNLIALPPCPVIYY